MFFKDFFSKKRNIIITSAAAATILALISVIVIIKSLPKAIDTTAPSLSTETSSTFEEPSSEVSSEIPEILLSVTSHKSKETTTTEPFTVFRGTCDPQFPLTINGETVEKDSNGIFVVEKQLKKGKNTFTFSHKGTDTTYTVNYRYIVIKSYSPNGNQNYKSGASFAVSVFARNGSSVKATFNNKTITLTKSNDKGGDEEIQQSDTFVNYTGSFSLPSNNTSDLNLGKVKFVASCNGTTNTYYSGKIVCKKADIPVIAEIVTFSAETFNGNTSDDTSRPTNNYLPKGTVDYVVGRAYNGNKEYLKLRCGRRVYVNKKVTPGNTVTAVAKEYYGTLPSSNKLSVDRLEVTERFTTLTLNTDWKAPFLLDLLPQSYTNPSKQDYTVSSVTCTYVEIQFCYASDFSGKIEFVEYHPLFKRAEIIKGNGNCKLRLYLRKTGGFYGWDASYNSSGQLVFKFLHPAQITEVSNFYGADLSGVKIMIDVGHGGIDKGASGLSTGNPESERNLFLAKKLKVQLESIGATVILNRTGDSTITTDERCKQLKEVSPDLCIAIHHDSSTSSKPNGFGAFHSTLFSRNAAKYIYDSTISEGIYSSSASNNRNRFGWHYYFVARMTDCPVVLTENGFMSSQTDHSGIISDSVNTLKAKAITKGIVKYFKSIKLDKIALNPEPQLPPVSSEPSSSSDVSDSIDSSLPPESSSSSDSSVSSEDSEASSSEQ
ncbi:MAG: N-acetylmuramoyl-L-alanine amidase [Acutalibacteraceae bacterium]|nr:N-acetylmuramoyl-L-alanine amidase [Acutalibacteraceae bacterium]